MWISAWSYIFMYILFFQGKLGELEAGIIGGNFMALQWIGSEYLNFFHCS